MSLEDRSEIAVTLLNQITNFVKIIEVNHYCDPEQFSDAQRTLKILINELSILDYKMEYLKYAYSNIILDQSA
jgi:hypothetical protein